MEKFFVEPYVFEKQAGNNLSSNTIQWPNEILQVLYGMYPILSNYPQMVSFNAKDDNNGSAAGQVVIKDLIIPFMIENYILKPMLVGYLKGQSVTECMPLTNGYLDKLFSTNSFYKNLTKKDAKGSRVEVSMSGEKVASLLDTIDGSVSSEDKLNLLNEIKNDKRLIATFKKSANLDFITKIANLETLSKDLEKIAEVEETDIEYVYKNKNLGWTKLSGKLGNSEFKKELLKEAEVTEGYFKTPIYTEIEKVANYTDTIKYKNELYKAVNLDSDISPISNMFISSNGNYITDLDKTAEWEISTESFDLKPAKLSAKESVIVKVGEREYIGPITISSTYEMEKSGKVLHGVCNFKKIAVVENSNLSSSFYDNKKDIAYIPKMEVVKVAKKINIVPFNKKASHKISIDNGDYYLIGSEFQKQSFKNPCSKEEAIWALLQTGANIKTIEKVSSVNYGEVNIEEDLKAPLSKEARVDTEFEEGLAKLKGFISSNLKGFIKEAASIADKTSLDVVLGLNLINEDNIIELINSLPIIDAALNSLSKLYLLTSAGLRSFDGSAIESVLQRLGVIRDTLESLSYTLKLNGKK